MFFDKKKKTVQHDIEFATSFKKEKLSVDALDHFAQTYAITPETLNHFSIPYVLKNGQQIKIDQSKIISTPNEMAFKHFEYLMGQTLAYHQDSYNFTLRDLMFIVDKNNQHILWANDKKDFAQFAKIANSLGFLIPIECLCTDPRNPVFGVIGSIQPVIHEDKEHPVPGED